MKSKMLNRIYAIVLCSLLLLATVGSAHAQTPIKIFESTHWAATQLETSLIDQIAREAFNLEEDDEKYLRVNIKVMYADDGQPDYLIAHLLYKNTYLYETFRINLDDGYQINSILENYQPNNADLAQDAPDASYASCPDESVDMVFATCETSIPTAVEGVDKAAEIAQQAGFKTRILKGNAENKAAYANWLSCNNLILLGRIGHGNSGGIMVSNGTVSSSFFSGLGSTALEDKVLYFNSCQVHKSPLEPAIVNAGVQKFIGGDVDLLIGDSEDVFKCFMQKVIAENSAMTSSLQNCEQQNYPEPGAHGISGNGSDYLSTNPNPNPNPNPGDGLQNGQTVSNLSANTDQWLYYTVNLPAGASDLEVKIDGGRGDADLYTQFNSKPTEESYECRPYKNGNSETCLKSSPKSGTWHLGIKGYKQFSGLNITVSWKESNPNPNPNPGGNVLQNGQTVSGLNASQGQWLYYTINVPHNADRLKIKIRDGKGDADLYTSFGSQPDEDFFYCRPLRNGNRETCLEYRPEGGTWHIGIYGYSSFSRLKLTASYQ